jgi:peptide/nickel transport system permease protein
VSAVAFDIGAPARPTTARLALAALRRVTREPMGTLGLVLVAIVLFCGLAADLVAPHDPLAIDIAARFVPPSWLHPLGTDQLGRDLLSRVILGSRIAMTVAVSAIAFSLLAGIALGLIAGYGPRWLDNALLLAFDAVYSFPTIMLALAIITLLGPSLATVVLVVVLGTAPVYARLIRTQTLAIKNSEFVLAERSLGAGRSRILVRHILPNVVGPLLIVASMDVPGVITIEAGLSFLGMGLPPPAPSWGRILNDGYAFIRTTPWIVIAGGAPLILTTLGFTFLGESLRDTLDPKLRRILR